MQQRQFVNQLVDKNDQATGCRLILNRYLVLFEKCVYIRKRKKLSTLIEIFLPILIFIYGLTQANKVSPIDRVPDQGFSFNTKFRQLNQNQFWNNFPYSRIYYDFDNRIDGRQLEDFLFSAFRDTKIP